MVVIMKPIFDVLRTTAAELQAKLTAGELSSTQIIDTYLNQIRSEDHYLKAILQLAPKSREHAKELDHERSQGQIRSRWHGIPIILKDNTATAPDLHLDTTAGSFALSGSISKRNAKVVDNLIAAGAIILGKANLSEFSGFKGNSSQPGWSAVGGQTQSAYVRGGLVPDGSILGHSSPGGSSTGCAVAVSAGYAPVAIGTETDGSLITPANRASLYALRPTQGLVPQDGTVPIARALETLGPMAKRVEDLANLLDVMVEASHPSVPKEGYASVMTRKWDTIRVGVLAPEKFVFAPSVMKPYDDATKQMNEEIRWAYAKIKELARSFHENISYVTLADLEHDGTDVLYKLIGNDFKTDLEAYLADLESSKVRTLEDIILFNQEHKDAELPEYSPDQAALEEGLNVSQKLHSEERLEIINWMRRKGGADGIDHYLKKYDIDVIIGPADCECTEPAAAAGYPLATMPLSYLNLNGRPFGLTVVASKFQEAKIIEVLSAWEATFPPRQPPPMLQRSVGSPSKDQGKFT